MSIKVEIKGIERVKKYLKSKQEEVKSDTQKGLFKAGVFMQGEVKMSIAGRRNEPTSVDTGRFLNSVDVSVLKDKAIVFSDVPYAKFLEFGTTKMGARRHFNNSKDRNKSKVRKIIDDSISI